MGLFHLDGALPCLAVHRHLHHKHALRKGLQITRLSGNCSCAYGGLGEFAGENLAPSSGLLAQCGGLAVIFVELQWPKFHRNSVESRSIKHFVDRNRRKTRRFQQKIAQKKSSPQAGSSTPASSPSNPSRATSKGRGSAGTTPGLKGNASNKPGNAESTEGLEGSSNRSVHFDPAGKTNQAPVWKDQKLRHGKVHLPDREVHIR